jgi:hypothetical protein
LLDHALQAAFEFEAVFLFGVHEGCFEQQAPLAQLKRQVLPGGIFFADLVAVSAEHVGPGLDAVFVAAQAVQRQFGAPAVIGQQAQRRLLPVFFAGHAPLQTGGQQVVAFAEDVGLHRQPVADAALGHKTAAVDRRADAFDGNARRLQRRTQGTPCVSRPQARAFAGHRGKHPGLGGCQFQQALGRLGRRPE